MDDEVPDRHRRHPERPMQMGIIAVNQRAATFVPGRVLRTANTVVEI